MRVLPALLAAGVLLATARGTAQGAGLVGANYQLSWDQAVDRTDAGVTDVRKLKHSIDIKYKGFLSPVVENEVTLKVEQETSSDAPETIRVFPTIIFGYKGNYWSAGAKRTIDDSNLPDTSPKIADAYFVEFFHQPPRKTLPDLKGKYTLDKDFEEGATDTLKHAITLSTAYKPNNWLDFKADYNRNITEDNLSADPSDKDEKMSATVGIRHLVSSKLKLDVQYKVEKTHGTGPKKDETHTLKNLIAFRPFAPTTVDFSYDYDLKRDIVTGDDALTRNAKVALAQKIGAPFDLKSDFSRNITQALHTADDTHKREDTWTVDLGANFSKMLVFTLKHQDKKVREVHADLTVVSPTTFNTTLTESATWSGELTRIWKASASFDRTTTYLWEVATGREVKSSIDDKYSLKTTLDFKEVNLLIDPSYDVTLKDDLIKGERTETKDLKVKFGYKVLTTRNIDFKVDHTYGRKTDSAANNILRTDNSSGNVTWKEPFPGWTFGLDLTRTGTDTSEDENEPDVTSAFGFKGDYKYDRFTMGTTYKFDKKKLTANAETFDIKLGWLAPSWDVSLTYSFKKTFSEALNEGYTINLAFKYNL